MNHKTLFVACSMLLAGSAVGFNQPAYAQDADTPAVAKQPPVVVDQPAEPDVQPVPEPVVEQDEAEAAQSMDDMLGSREAAPVIAPNDRRPGKTRSEPVLTAPAAIAVDIDPAVLGVAPGDEPPPLRREGEFIVNRRGRLIRSPETGRLLFVLEADSEQSPELPLVMQACQLLETMEDTTDRRGDTTVFILSGQVHTYRGANYLMPTMMKIAVDDGNLTN